MKSIASSPHAIVLFHSFSSVEPRKELVFRIRRNTVVTVFFPEGHFLKMKLGFQFVPFPREIWADAIDLSQAEFRLLGWFCCNLRFGVQQFEMTDDNILNGVTQGRHTYPPVGLSRNSMQKARSLLTKKQLLVATQISNGGGRGKAARWSYSLNLSDSDENTEETSQGVTINSSDCEKNTQLNLSDFDNAIKEERKNQRSTERIGVHPTLEEVRMYCLERGSVIDPEKWFDYYSANGWKVGRHPMKDWKAAVRTWEKNSYGNGNRHKPKHQEAVDAALDARVAARRAVGLDN
jgi:hypothetical protein